MLSPVGTTPSSTASTRPGSAPNCAASDLVKVRKVRARNSPSSKPLAETENSAGAPTLADTHAPGKDRLIGRIGGACGAQNRLVTGQRVVGEPHCLEIHRIRSGGAGHGVALAIDELPVIGLRLAGHAVAGGLPFRPQPVDIAMMQPEDRVERRHSIDHMAIGVAGDDMRHSVRLTLDRVLEIAEIGDFQAIGDPLLGKDRRTDLQVSECAFEGSFQNVTFNAPLS